MNILNSNDEFTCEALACEVDHSVTAADVVAVLERLVIERGGPPAFVPMDNGGEIAAIAIARWSAETGVGAVFNGTGVAVAQRDYR